MQKQFRYEGEKRYDRIRFWPNPNVLKEEYLDIYEGIQSARLNTTRCDKNSDISTTYLGKSDRSKNDKLKAEESFPISEQGYTLGKLLEGSECQMLLDTGASKSFMSKSYYMHCKSLHSLPKFASKTENSDRKWSFCQYIIYNLCNNICTWTQI